MAEDIQACGDAESLVSVWLIGFSQYRHHLLADSSGFRPLNGICGIEAVVDESPMRPTGIEGIDLPKAD